MEKGGGLTSHQAYITRDCVFVSSHWVDGTSSRAKLKTLPPSP